MWYAGFYKKYWQTKGEATNPNKKALKITVRAWKGIEFDCLITVWTLDILLTDW